MNDIADTSVCIQTSAQFVSLRREQDARSFLLPDLDFVHFQLNNKQPTTTA